MFPLLLPVNGNHFLNDYCFTLGEQRISALYIKNCIILSYIENFLQTMEHCSEIRSLFVVSRFQIRLSKSTNDHCIVLHVMYGQISPAKDILLRILSDCFQKQRKNKGLFVASLLL